LWVYSADHLSTFHPDALCPVTSPTTPSRTRGQFPWARHVESALDAVSKKRFLPVLILIVGLLPSAWLLYVVRDTPHLGLAADDVMYIGAAQSLAREGSYREAALPGDPWQTKYPPGYPLMLAAILKLNLSARNFWIIAHSWVWLSLASFALAWAMRRAGLSPVEAALVGALWAANPSGVDSGVSALADAPYCAVLFLTLGLVLRLDKDTIRNAALAGLVMGFACLIRSAGIVAIVGLVTWLCWRRNLRAAFCFGISASIIPAIWMVWSHAHSSPAHGPVAEFYFDYVGRWLQTVRQTGLGLILKKNILFGLNSLGEWLIPFESRPLLQVFGCTILLAFGCAALAEWGGGAITAVALATLGFQLFWNWPPNGRFFLPVAPAFLGAFVAMLSSRPWSSRIIILSVVAIADVYGVAGLEQTYAGQRDSGLSPVYAFIKTELPANAVILGDERVWLFTGRRALEMVMPTEYWYLERPDLEMEFFMSYKDVARQFGANYVLIGHWGKLHMDTVAVRSDPGLERVFSRNGLELFRIRTVATPSP